MKVNGNIFPEGESCGAPATSCRSSSRDSSYVKCDLLPTNPIPDKPAKFIQSSLFSATFNTYAGMSASASADLRSDLGMKSDLSDAGKPNAATRQPGRIFSVNEILTSDDDTQTSSSSKFRDTSGASDSGVTSNGSSYCSWSSSSERQEEDDSEVSSSCGSPGDCLPPPDLGHHDDDGDSWPEPFRKARILMAPVTCPSGALATAVNGRASPSSLMLSSNSSSLVVTSQDLNGAMCKACNASVAVGGATGRFRDERNVPRNAEHSLWTKRRHPGTNLRRNYRQNERMDRGEDATVPSRHGNGCVIPRMDSVSSPCRRWVQAAMITLGRPVTPRSRRCNSEPPAIPACSAVMSQGMDCEESPSSGFMDIDTPSDDVSGLLGEDHEADGDIDVDVDEGIESDSKSDAGVCSSSEDHSSNGCDIELRCGSSGIDTDSRSDEGGRRVSFLLSSDTVESTSESTGPDLRVGHDVLPPVPLLASPSTVQAPTEERKDDELPRPPSPKRIRFPPERSSSTVQAPSAAINGLCSGPIAPPRKPCMWEGCGAGFGTNAALAQHITAAHVVPQDDGAVSSSASTVTAVATRRNRRSAADEHTKPKVVYVCRWEGCKAFGRPSLSREWISQHALTVHGGFKPFQCMMEGCDHNFSSQLLLERHINQHFERDRLNGARLSVDDGSGGSGSFSNGLYPGRKGCETTPVKSGKKSIKKGIRYRNRPWSVDNYDFWDGRTTEHLSNAVVRTEKRLLLAACGKPLTCAGCGDHKDLQELDGPKETAVYTLHPAIARALLPTAPSSTTTQLRVKALMTEAAEEVGMSPSEVLDDPPVKPAVEKVKSKKQSRKAKFHSSEAETAESTSTLSASRTEETSLPYGFIEFNGEVIARRSGSSGLDFYLVRWTPEELLPEEWLTNEDLERYGEKLVKRVSIHSLPHSRAFEMSEHLVVGPSSRKRLRPTRRK